MKDKEKLGKIVGLLAEKSLEKLKKERNDICPAFLLDSYMRGFYDCLEWQETIDDKALEKAAEEYAATGEFLPNGKEMISFDKEKAFIAGAQWQKRKGLESANIEIDNIELVDLENLEYPVDYVKGHSDGYNNARREMMKDAKEASFIQNYAYKQPILEGCLKGLKSGDKVKVIILPNE